MVCDRCIAVISDSLISLGLQIKEIYLGTVVVDSSARMPDTNELASFLRQLGFDLVTDKKAELTARIKEVIEKGIQARIETGITIKFSSLLTGKLYQNYDTISSAFAATEHITIEKYIIRRRLQIVAELLRNSNRSLTDIAYSIGYSSVAHLSRQFQETFGISASRFRAGTSVERYFA
jgi:AraC-like DNA-binding protein